MNLHMLINWTSPFLFYGMLGAILFYFYPNFDRIFCKHTVETLIKGNILRHLIWVCTVCLCPTKWTLGLYGLSSCGPDKNYRHQNENRPRAITPKIQHVKARLFCTALQYSSKRYDNEISCQCDMELCSG